MQSLQHAGGVGGADDCPAILPRRQAPAAAAQASNAVTLSIFATGMVRHQI